MALKVLTSNVASILKLRGKGFISNDMDADILFLNKGVGNGTPDCNGEMGCKGWGSSEKRCL